MTILPRLRLLVSLLVALSAASAPLCFGQEWEKVLAAAKKEGKVAIIGPVGADRRDVLVEPFQKKYGITVEYFADRGSGIGPRLSAERGAGQYLWDVVITGTTTGLLSLLPGGMLDPIEPALVLPDVKDPKQWRGGALDFVDPGKAFPRDDAVPAGHPFCQPESGQTAGNQILQRSAEPQMAQKNRHRRPDPSRTRAGDVYVLLSASRARSKFYSRLGQTRARRSCETILRRLTASPEKNIPY